VSFPQPSPGFSASSCPSSSAGYPNTKEPSPSRGWTERWWGDISRFWCCRSWSCLRLLGLFLVSDFWFGSGMLMCVFLCRFGQELDY
jgi:hypothetical protein